MEKRSLHTITTIGACLVLLVTASGCVTKTKAGRQAQEAFQQGRQAAFAEMAAQNIKIKGNVQKNSVPWVAGLNLTQALVTANYVGIDEPTTIIVTRRDQPATIHPQDLANGSIILLEPGDMVEIY